MSLPIILIPAIALFAVFGVKWIITGSIETEDIGLDSNMIGVTYYIPLLSEMMRDGQSSYDWTLTISLIVILTLMFNTAFYSRFKRDPGDFPRYKDCCLWLGLFVFATGLILSVIYSL